MDIGAGQKNNPSTGEPTKPEPYEIHVMPPKFRVVKAKGSASKVLIIFGIVFFILALLGIGGYFFYLQMSQVGQNVNQANLNQEAVNNANLNQANENLNLENLNSLENLNVNGNLNANENINAELNANLNVNENINANLNANANANINAPAQTLNYTSSLDSDNDKVTDVEEDLYQTDKRTADTDGDGYLDGDEIINGYNPKVAGGAKLETSGLVNKYTNPVYNYQILYPTSWLARPEDQSLQAVLFITGTEEFMRIAVEDNPNKLDLVSWYMQLSPQADLNLLEKIKTVKGYDALVSPDKLTYYILDPNVQNKVYVINYNIDALAQINFLSTFQMMVNSFAVVPIVP